MKFTLKRNNKTLLDYILQNMPLDCISITLVCEIPNDVKCEQKIVKKDMPKVEDANDLTGITTVEHIF